MESEPIIVGLSNRVDNLEKDNKNFLNYAVKIAVIEQNIKTLQGDISSISEEVHSLRKTMIGFAMSISLSAIVFAFTVFELLGKSVVKQ